MKGMKKVDYDVRLTVASTVAWLFQAAVEMAGDLPKPVRDSAIEQLFEHEALALRALGFMYDGDQLTEYEHVEIEPKIIDIRGVV